MKGKILAIDHGLRRIGIAISDENHEFAWPRDIIHPDDFEREFKRIVFEENIKYIVVGMPIMLDGTRGEQCVVVEQFIEALKNIWSGPIFTWDERMSSRTTRILYNTSHDSVVAMSILENFMMSGQVNMQNK